MKKSDVSLKQPTELREMLTRELGCQLLDPLVVGEEGALLLVGRLHLARDLADLGLQLAHLGPQQAHEVTLHTWYDTQSGLLVLAVAYD